MALQCVWYYVRNKIPLLGTSLFTVQKSTFQINSLGIFGRQWLDNKSSPLQSGRGWIWYCQIDNQSMSSISLNLSTNSTSEAWKPRRDTGILTDIAGLDFTWWPKGERFESQHERTSVVGISKVFEVFLFQLGYKNLLASVLSWRVSHPREALYRSVCIVPADSVNQIPETTLPLWQSIT